MDLMKAEALALKMMSKYLDMSKWSFGWSRSKTNFGLCRERYNIITKETIRGTIFLSKPLTEIETEEHVTNTILHEIAHAIAGGEAGHGPAWKRVARSLGISGERCGSHSEGVSGIAPKYVMISPDGKIVKHYHRKPNKSTFEKVSRMYIPDRYEETFGKMKIVPYSAVS